MRGFFGFGGALAVFFGVIDSVTAGLVAGVSAAVLTLGGVGGLFVSVAVVSGVFAVEEVTVSGVFCDASAAVVVVVVAAAVLGACVFVAGVSTVAVCAGGVGDNTWLKPTITSAPTETVTTSTIAHCSHVSLNNSAVTASAVTTFVSVSDSTGVVRRT